MSISIIIHILTNLYIFRLFISTKQVNHYYMKRSDYEKIFNFSYDFVLCNALDGMYQKRHKLSSN